MHGDDALSVVNTQLFYAPRVTQTLVFYIKLVPVRSLETLAMFVWIISHQPAVLFSQNKPVISNQPPAKRTGCLNQAKQTS
jgi:hypothetical protein